MQAKFAYELIKDVEEDCQKKGFRDFADRLKKISKDLLVEVDREELLKESDR